MNNYSISMEDVRGYLASKAPSEVVGFPMLSDGCLIAQTLHWKYQELTYVDVSYLNTSAEVRMPGRIEVVGVPGEVRDLAATFDKFPNRYTKPVTKAELAEYMPELFTNG